MHFFRRHIASVVTVAISVAILVGLVLVIPSTPQNPVQLDQLEGSGSRIDFPTKSITLTYWRTLDGLAPFEDILKDYKQLHPNVTIKLSNLKYADYDKQLTEAAKSGKLPDVYAVRDDWLPRYQQYLTPAPTTVYTVDEFKEAFVPVAADRLAQGSQVNGLAYGVSTLGLFYNEDLLAAAGYKKPPSSWQELMTMSKKLTVKNGADVTTAGVALGNTGANYTAILSVLMQQNGATMTDSLLSQALFNKPDGADYPAAAKALSFYTSFGRSGSENYSWNSKLGNALDAFKAGKAAMMIDYAYRAPEIDAASPDLKYKMAALPQVNATKPVNQAEFWAELVNKNSKNPEVAWDFVRFAATRAQMNRYSIATYRPGSRKDLVAEQSQDVYLGPFAKQLTSATDWYKGNSYNIDGIFADMINAVLGGGAPQPAVDTAAARTTQEIVRSK